MEKELKKKRLAKYITVGIFILFAVSCIIGFSIEGADSIFEKKIKRYHMLKRIMKAINPEKVGLNDLYIYAYNEHQKIEHWLTEEKLYDDIRGSSGI